MGLREMYEAMAGKGERMTKDEQFEITKHFASILNMHFGWISCHTLSDGSAITYRTAFDPPDLPRRMSAVQVLSAGAKIEIGRKKDDA